MIDCDDKEREERKRMEAFEEEWKRVKAEDLNFLPTHNNTRILQQREKRRQQREKL